jgi:hypothetical protein
MLRMLFVRRGAIAEKLPAGGRDFERLNLLTILFL